MAKIQYMPPRAAANERISSLEKNPEVSGKAASAREPIRMAADVNGIAFRKPDMRSMFCSPAIAPITDPAAMNRSALKKAWVMRWNIPAE